MRRLLSLFAVFAFATTAQAHQLNVFAFVEEGTVVVETKLSNGNLPVSGDVEVLNAQSEVLMTLPLEKDGTVRFPLDMNDVGEGITIEVTTGEGHEDYWILTPEDIARGSGG